jgi:putative transposase
MTDWPHAPLHRLAERGTYMVTCGTYLKQHHLNTPERLDFFRDLLFELAQEFGWQLQAWAILSNHYHWVGVSPETPDTLRRFASKLHTLSATQLNQWDATPGRKVWFQYYDSRITFQTSYFARLKYVHQNAVHHAVANAAVNYPWCSAAWFERNSPPAFRRMVEQFKTDRVEVLDEFAPLIAGGESGGKRPTTNEHESTRMQAR